MEPESFNRTRQARRRKRFKIPTPDNLANVALFYLSRFAASEESLRRVLENRIRRAAMVNADFAANTATQEKLRHVIGSIIGQHRKSGVLNDAAFAEMKVNSLRRAGRSQRRIAQQLHSKGVAPEIIEKALKPDDDENADVAEHKAALAFARRRTLGPFRKKAASFEQLRKDMATMARAGFSYDMARQVLDGDGDE